MERGLPVRKDSRLDDPFAGNDARAPLKRNNSGLFGQPPLRFLLLEYRYDEKSGE